MVIKVVTIIALSLAAILPQPDGVTRDVCDLIEVNHFFDEQGRLVFQQAIFWDWSDDEGRYNVRAWRLVKEPAQLPQRDWRAGGYFALWQDGELIRRVQAGAIRETWTQFDPEILERDYLPAERRQPLKGK